MSNLVNLKAEGQWSFSDTCSTMDALRLAGIECGISVGGLWLLLESPDQGRAAKAIVEQHGGWLCAETMAEGLDMQPRSRAWLEALGAKQDFIRQL